MNPDPNHTAPDESPQQCEEVWITGIGCVSPIGGNCDETEESLRLGKSGFREVDFFDVANQRVKTAGIARISPSIQAQNHLSKKEKALLDRGTRILIESTAEALQSADLPTPIDAIPIVLGTSAAAMSEGENYYKQALTSPRSNRQQFSRVERYQPQRQAATLCRALEIAGPVTIISNACASGANALGHGFHLIRHGLSSRVLAGGFDALCQLVFAGFDSLQALAPSGIPRPFDAERDGLALGEGGAMFVLESATAARARGAKPIAILAGYGMSLDSHHLTQPHPEGNAAFASMNKACASANITPSEIAYLNSHGTGTPLNDVAEAHAIRRWAGESASSLPVSSTKSATGHLLGGAGALEAAICVLAMRGQFLPASINVREPDPAVTFDLIREPRPDVALPTSLTNSFGFGGSNATLIFRNPA